jgi:hypothetical protein
MQIPFDEIIKKPGRAGQIWYEKLKFVIGQKRYFPALYE